MYLAHSFMSDEKKQNSHQPLILAVEDDDDSLLVVSYALESMGYRFICQTDSSATVLVAKEYQPDLILLDILLPGLSGMDVVRHLKLEPLTCTIPVVAVTALASTEDRERILKAGFNDYISKPYMLEELEAIIRRELGRKFTPYPALKLCQD
ncbi:response regulator [uncultured Nostoc sp.]|uniref:response regulator n=1 Tax=uncultured Nostoc sp. TaxID=340711 RepID=UPI0035CC47B7